MSIEIKQLLPYGYCLSCRGCCRFKEKISAWAPRLLREEINSFEAKNLDGKSLRLVEDGVDNDYACVFLSVKDSVCKVYYKRPFECMLYPFLINRERDKVYLSADPNCPFISENLHTVEFKKYSDYLLKLLAGKLGKELKKNPLIAQSYGKMINIGKLG